MLKPDEEQELTLKYGAGWCRCMMRRVEEITPSMLRDYIESCGFKPYSRMEEDGKIKRYSYFLQSQKVIVDAQTGETGNYNVVATFFDFGGKWLKNQSEGIIDSIKRLSATLQKPADTVAAEIIALAETKKPSEGESLQQQGGSDPGDPSPMQQQP